MELTSLPEALQNKLRLAILAALSQGPADFTSLKKGLGATDGNLGRQLEILTDGGYLEISRQARGARVKTTYSITSWGKQNFVEYVELLTKIAREMN